MGPKTACIAASFPLLPDQLRKSGFWDEGERSTAWSGLSTLVATGVRGRGGMHLAIRTVRSSIPSPIAIARSQAFNSPAIRSSRTKLRFMETSHAYLGCGKHTPNYVAMQH